ncbi:maleylpyruvate isomerase family mycothiol-dependent enzyme [Glutamicibacter sp. NPDC087344]|uniref:maleylpyruvate isomerase family mycothiol-dependent enzyme n=1 Tax=Glutamicibacter sp. NPDC087344 TaxID=3363994 RepID=UPI0037FA7BD7
MDEVTRWRLIDEERRRLCVVLAALKPEQWAYSTLCGAWDVRHVVAHLKAAGSTGTFAWLVNMARSGLNTDRHNEGLMAPALKLGAVELLKSYQTASDARIAPFGSSQGLLGEVLVHSQDIAQPLGIELAPSEQALREVAEFFASKNFAVNSKTLVKKLSLVALDHEFTAGAGLEVRGSLVDLIMAMAGRQTACERLEGEGAEILTSRIAAQNH